ncbi:hypothetical protein [Halomonas sp. DP1Y21-3]|uniref:DUF7281 domain-containing protein n=1 Tax=Halomonas sp. DP1Y21-3 TaxID=2859080 RepID=UPI0028F6F5D7|nr:hypothetical protein [Halomonas sp. DP1Y21-3]
MIELSNRARNVLKNIQGELDISPRTERKRETAAIANIEAWCDAHDIWLDGYRWGKTLRFDRRLLADIDAMLDSLKQPGLGQSLSGLSTVEQAKLGIREDKNVREPPRRYRVLVSAPSTQHRPGFPAVVRETLEVDGRTLELAAFDALVQVENLDSVHELKVTQAELGGFANPLVVYRGDKIYRKGFDDLVVAWGRRFRDQRPHLYLGDFDAAGVREALSSAADGMLLPRLSWLAHEADSQHQRAEQLPYKKALERHCARLPAAHPLRDYLALILDQQRGLRQQWFAGPLEAVALR